MTSARIWKLVAVSAAIAGFVHGQALTISGSLPQATEESPYSAQLAASGGTPPYQFSLGEGSNLALGLQFGSNGQITGTPLVFGSFQLNVLVTDRSSPPLNGSAQYSLNVQQKASPPLEFVTTTLPNAQYAAFYSTFIQVTGGRPPYNFFAQAFILTLHSGTGELYGTPSILGVSQIPVTVSDSSVPQKSVQRTFSLNVLPGLVMGDTTYPTATVGSSYNAQIAVFSGTPPYTFTITNGFLPPGLQLNGATGLISGTPTNAGTFPFKVAVTDQNGLTGAANLIIPVTGPPIVITPTSAAGAVNAPFPTITLNISGGTAPYTLSLPFGQVVPPGLNFNLNTGVLSGTPTVGNTYQFQVNVSDKYGFTGFGVLSLYVADILPTDLVTGVAGVFYSTAFSPTGFRPGGVALSHVAGTLPPGLTLFGNTLSGTPTAAGTYNFTLQAQGSGVTVQRSFSLTIGPPFGSQINVSPNMPNGILGQAYSAQIQVTNATPPVTFVKGQGTIPPGLTMSSSGLVTGTPTATGSHGFDVQVSDSGGKTGSGNVLINVLAFPVTISPPTIPNGTVGQPYSVQFSGQNGPTPPSFTWNLALAVIPGLVLDASTGLYSGTPTTPGTYTIRVEVTAGPAYNGSQTYTVTIAGSGVVQSKVFVNGTVNQAYDQSLYAGQPLNPYSLTSGALPPGLTMTNTSPGFLKVSGIPTAVGFYQFQVQATDSDGLTHTFNCTLTVITQTIVVSPASIPTGFVTLPYSANFSASGGAPPYVFSSPLALPTGLTLSSSGVLQGTPQTSGNFTIRIVATDQSSLQGSRDYPVTIVGSTLSLSPQVLPSGTLGQVYGALISASGGTTPYTFQLTSGALPNGMTLASSGNLSGTPQQAGYFSFGVAAQDALGALGVRNYQLTIAGNTITLGPNALPTAFAGQPYSAQLVATGGVAPYTFLLTEGVSWAAGMSVNPNGSITGTPPPGLDTMLIFTVQATDAQGSTGTRQFQIELKSGTVTLTISPASIPSGSIESFYSVTFSATGGEAPYSFTATSTLPAGLTLNVSGLLSGTPLIPGGAGVNIRVTDHNGVTATKNYILTIVGLPPLTLTPGDIPSAGLQAPYSVIFQGGGGTAPYTFDISQGALPPGLTLSASGVLSGTATTPGFNAFTIRVRDSGTKTGLFPFNLTIAATPIVLGPPSLPDGSLSKPYSVQLTVTFGKAPFNFGIASGSLPPGLRLFPDGTISGTPTGPTNTAFPFSIVVTDANGTRDIRAFEVQIHLLSVSTTSVSPAQQQIFYSTMLQAAGGTPPYTWQVTQGALPDGINLTAAGLLAGAPVVAGPFDFTALVTEANGDTALKAFSLSVNASPAPVNSLVLNPPMLTFHARVGATSIPQCISIHSTEVQAQVSATLTGSASLWTALPFNQFQTPTVLCLTANPSVLSAGAYQGTLKFTSTSAGPGVIEVPMRLIAEPGDSALRVAPDRIRVVVARGDGPIERSLVMSNDGFDPVVYSVRPIGEAWASVSPSTGSVEARTSRAAALRINPAGLERGVYATKIVVDDPSGSHTVTVELVVSDAPAKLTLAQTALEFVAWSGGAAAQAALGVANQGATPVGLTIGTHTTNTGTWLTVAVPPAQLNAGEAVALQVRVNPLNLAPGRYTGWLNVGVTGSASSQVVIVGLTVLAADTPTPPGATNYSLALTSAAPQGTVALEVPPIPGLKYTTAVFTNDGAWLTVAPAQAFVPPGGALQLSATAQLAGLGAGLHSGLIAIGLSDGTAFSIPVDLFIPASAAGGAARPAGAPCTGGSIVAQMASPVGQFAAKVGRPLAVRVLVHSCDGSPLPAGIGVTAHSANEHFALLPEAAGVWSGTWIPAQPNAEALLKVAVASAGGAAVEIEAEGSIAAGPNDPVIAAVVSAATQRLYDPAAPGGWLTIFGANLADETGIADEPVFPTLMQGVEATLDDIPLRLFYVSPSQINAVAPLNLQPDRSYQLLLRRNGTPAAPAVVTVAEVSPGLFTLNQQGTGQAAARIWNTANLAGPETPVARNGIVELYGTGLGSVTDPPGDGAPASLTQLSFVNSPVTATVGGQQAEVLFAGLAPGYVGLYQINVRVPVDAPLGDAVEVVVVQKNARSATVTIAVH